MATRAGAAEDRKLVTQARVTGVMALVFAAGFSFALAMGRSSFGAPLIVHIHGIIFFGWVAISLLQAGLAAGANIVWHKRIGWLGVAWIFAMLVLGPVVAVAAVQTGRVPFVFQPQHFLIDDTLSVLCFAALALTAIARRRDTGWHRRLHLCALASLMGPAFGRLLPMPFMLGYNFQVASLCGLLFPAWMLWREWRATGTVHPAWLPGMIAVPVTLIAGWLLAESTPGAALYQAVAAGTPGAAFPGLAYPPPPPGA